MILIVMFSLKQVHCLQSMQRLLRLVCCRRPGKVSEVIECRSRGGRGGEVWEGRWGRVSSGEVLLR
jgi:hypothetical protein